jgi:hypothetical protein
VFDSGELPDLFRDLRVAAYQETIDSSDFGMERVRLVRFCAEKPCRVPLRQTTKRDRLPLFFNGQLR